MKQTPKKNQTIDDNKDATEGYLQAFTLSFQSAQMDKMRLEALRVNWNVQSHCANFSYTLSAEKSEWQKAGFQLKSDQFLIEQHETGECTQLWWEKLLNLLDKSQFWKREFPNAMIGLDGNSSTFRAERLNSTEATEYDVWCIQSDHAFYPLFTHLLKLLPEAIQQHLLKQL